MKEHIEETNDFLLIILIFIKIFINLNLDNIF